MKAGNNLITINYLPLNMEYIIVLVNVFTYLEEPFLDKVLLIIDSPL